MNDQQSAELRDPSESDDLQGIVRYHGANAVLDAVLDVAAEVYGEDRIAEKIHEFVLRRVEHRFSSAMTHCANCGGEVPTDKPHKVGECVAPT